jgi:phosphoribosylamine---glycine ligase
MKILVIGSGGREHAICAAFAASRRTDQIFCAPGNAGIANVADRVPIPAEDIDALAAFASGNSIDLTFVGGEGPLAMGIADVFGQRGLRIVGASKAAARLEASKAFAKEFMTRHAVPTAQYAICQSPQEAAAVLRSGRFGDATAPTVVKADGLAAGKGVIVAAGRNEALAAVSELEGIAGASAASRIVLEECLVGREVSLLMFADGNNFCLMPGTRDHKRLGEGDTGPNTGGMGTFTDDSLLTCQQLADIEASIIRPTLAGCAEEGFPFRGVLFLGLMMTEGGARVLEYNVRFGDPETQSLLVRLETDMVEVCEAILEGRLDRTEVRWRPGSSATVVLAAHGYPYSPRKGDAISGIDEAATLPDVRVFHAGTAVNERGEFLTSGGRVLGVTATGSDLDEALASAYGAVGRIKWDGMQYRRDIGK